MPARLSIVLAALALAAPATAGEAYDHALAAGYKAAFLCSGIFNAGRSAAEIERDELSRTYPSLRPHIENLKADIDRERRRVTVAFDTAMPPRVAQHQGRLGCMQYPIGADPAAALASKLTRADANDYARWRWPLGDAGAEAKAPPEALAPLAARAFDGMTYGEETKTSAILVVKDGKIVHEQYAHGIDKHTPQRTWSVAKSIAGTLLGVAAQQGLIDFTAPVPIPDWQADGDPRRAITIENLMRMASGLTSDFAGNRTDAVYFGGTSVADSAPGQSLLRTPGSTFRYANNDTLLAMYGLRHKMADRDAYRLFPFEALFAKIGMMHTYPETDWRGDFIMSSQVWTTARDLARLGLLYLNDGMFRRERLLPENYAAFVSTKRAAQPDRDWGYGATFWVANEETGLPEGTFAAMGNRGQYLVIVPSEKLLVIRRGFDPVGEDKRFDIAGFTADVIAATRNVTKRER